MADRKNYLTEANDILTERRRKAENEADRKKADLYKIIPGLSDIDSLLAATMTDYFAAVVSKDKARSEEIIENNKKNQAARRELLKKNGYPEDYTDPVYECDLCHDSGYIGINMCPCCRTLIAEARLRDSVLGPLAGEQTFDNFSFDYYTGANLMNIKKNYEILRKFAEDFTSNTYENFLLLGDTGLGKTHLSTALGVRIIRRGYDVIYNSIQAVIDDFHEIQFRGGDLSSVRQYYDCSLLIIDDLGVEMSNQFTVSTIYNLLNSRINARRSTVINTNLSQNELRDRYSDRITSRIFGEYHPLMFSGTDIRRQKLKQGL